MNILTFLLLLFNLVPLGTCSNKVWVLKYNQDTNCPNPNVGIPIEPHSVNKGFTFCGKYNFKFLRRSTLMSLGGTDIFLKVYDFEAKKISSKYDGGYYIFDFQNQTLIPNEWYHICLAISMNQLKVVLNGEILTNEEVNLVAKKQR